MKERSHRVSNMKYYLIVGGCISLLLTIGVVYAIESGLINKLSTFNWLFMITGALLLYVSAFCLGQMHVTDWSQREKAITLFGPVLSSALIGLGSICAGLYEANLLSDVWWLPLALLALGFITFQITVILAVQILWQRWRRTDTQPSGSN
jgi:hypothetical protein